MIPENHPRYRSLITREKMAAAARSGIVALEGLTSHGRGEAFDYLIGEVTTASAREAELLAAALLLTAKHPIISVNGNTAALASPEIAELQKVTGARVEVNLFHRTEKRVEMISNLLRSSGVSVLEGPVERFIPLDHDRGLCHADGMYAADLILVPLEDGDRAEVLMKMGKTVIAIDLNPLSRTAQVASLPIIDEVTRAIPNITASCRNLDLSEAEKRTAAWNGKQYLHDAIVCIQRRLTDVLV